MTQSQDKNVRFNVLLKKARESTGMTQETLAFAAQVSLKTYWRWEAGTGEPNLLQLHLIASACGVNPGWLVTGKGEMEIRPEPSEREIKDTLVWQANRIRELEEENARLKGFVLDEGDAEKVRRQHPPAPEADDQKRKVPRRS